MHPIFTLIANKFIDKYGYATCIKIATFFVIIGSGLRCLININYYYTIAGMAVFGIARPFVINS